MFRNISAESGLSQHRLPLGHVPLQGGTRQSELQKELTEDHGVRVDHVHVGVLIVGEGLADVPLQTLEARRRSAPLPLGVQAPEQVVDAYLGVGEREVETVVVAALRPEPLLEGLELRELVAVDLPRPEDPPEVGGVHVFCASVVPHLGLSLA